MGQSAGRETRNKILEAAESEFSRHGYAGAHLEAIASQVGVRKTALYHHFPSKAALYEAVLLRMLGVFEQSVVAAMERAGTPTEQLEAIIESTNGLMAEHPNYARLLLRVFIERPSELRTAELGSRLGALIGRRLDVFKQGMDEGTFHRQSTRHLFMSMMGASVLYYASGSLAAFAVGVDDVFTHEAVAWRLKELRRFLRNAILSEPEPS